MQIETDFFDLLSESMRIVKSLFGGHIDRLLKVDKRHSAAPSCGDTRHRLAVLIGLAEQSLATRNDRIPSANLPAFVELGITAKVFERWKNDPLWPEMVKTISDPTSYPHAVHVLLCASQFPDQHVSLIPTSPGARSPDLLVEFDHNNKLTIEVKAPQKLQRPEPILDGELSEKEIIRLVRKADHREGDS